MKDGNEIRERFPEENNIDFVQLSRSYLRNWRGLIRKNPLSAEVLMFLIEKMGKPTNAVICSYKTLQESTGYGRSSIGNAIKVLKDDNWIQSIKVGSATAYCVNAKVAWQTTRNQMKYAVFSATVVASMTEQDKEYIEDKTELKYIPYTSHKDHMIVDDKEQLPPPDQQDLPLD